MRDGGLRFLGVGRYVPPARTVADQVTAAGGRLGQYEGWPHVAVGGAEDHPSTMGVATLHEALKESRVRPEQLTLVVSCCLSRDYVVPWSVAYEIMRRLEVPFTYFGCDIIAGCAGSLTALEFARN